MGDAYEMMGPGASGNVPEVPRLLPTPPFSPAEALPQAPHASGTQSVDNSEKSL